MSPPIKILVVAALAAAVAVAVSVKKNAQPSETGRPNSAPAATDGSKLPRLLDLGANKCVPCKAMAPILEDLKKDYAGRMTVEFIDVWQDEEAGKRYGVEMIPTQIFYDADGKELFRHTGFYGREDILAKWKELGVDLGGT